MQPPPAGLTEEITAATSPDWSVRVRAGRQLAYRAEHPRVADLLLRLVLDEDDTAVTDATSQALLQRDDVHGVRVLARAAAVADDECLDHLSAAVTGHLQPAGPVRQFIGLCTGLSRDADPAVRAGVEHFLAWVTPWAPTG